MKKLIFVLLFASGFSDSAAGNKANPDLPETSQNHLLPTSEVCDVAQSPSPKPQVVKKDEDLRRKEKEIHDYVKLQVDSSLKEKLSETRAREHTDACEKQRLKEVNRTCENAPAPNHTSAYFAKVFEKCI